MQDQQDIRWKQRFANYKKAMQQLQKFIDKKVLSELEEQGLIKAFEYTYELAWKTLQDYMKDQGLQNLGGPKNILMEAFNVGLITNGDVWSEMMKSRNLTSHSYNEDTASKIADSVKNLFYEQFVTLEQTFEKR